MATFRVPVTGTETTTVWGFIEVEAKAAKAAINKVEKMIDEGELDSGDLDSEHEGGEYSIDEDGEIVEVEVVEGE